MGQTTQIVTDSRMSRLKDYLPKREAELVTWSNNYSTRISATPLVFGLSVLQASDFATLNDAWIAAYNTASSDLTNSRAARLAKRDAKRAMIDGVRPLVKINQAFPGLTDAQRADLGITVPAIPAPRPAPTVAPTLLVLSSANHVVKLRLTNVDSPSRAKPKDASIAYIFSHIGPTVPSDVTEWNFQGTTSRGDVSVALNPSTPPGTQVWFTSCWLNARQQPGPMGPAVTTNVAGGVSGAEATLKIAA
jgi:hypothetical protein